MPIPFKEHAQSVFLDRNHFSETVVYRPKGGTPRSIKAVVSRQQFEGVPGGGNFNSPAFMVVVENDAIKGIYLPELNRGNDAMDFPERETDRQASTFKIERVMDQDRGMLTLEVR